MTSNLPSLFGRVTAVLGEHAALRGTVHQLREMCTVLTDEHPQEDAGLRELIGAFSEQLLSHFAAEEAEGYFGTLVADSPELATQVARLRAEHLEMAAQVRELEILAADVAGSHLSLSESLQKLLDRFDVHERAENLLLQDFFLRDEGA